MENAGTNAVTPACALPSPAEVALVLDAHATDGRRAGGPEEGCKYTSTLDKNDRLSMWMTHGSTVTDTFDRVRRGAASPVDVPGVGRAAYATLSRNGILQVRVLGNESCDPRRSMNLGTLFTLSLHLVPDATMQDLPELSKLARLVFERWGGKAPLNLKQAAWHESLGMGVGSVPDVDPPEGMWIAIDNRPALKPSIDDYQAGRYADARNKIATRLCPATWTYFATWV